MKRLLVTTMSMGCVLSAAVHLCAQQRPVAYVPTGSAAVSGAVVISGTRAGLRGSNIVTAMDRTAVVTLARGGKVNVCQTSALHVTSSTNSDGLLLALDRGALEMQMFASTSDVLMTPDLRFVVASGGTMDLRLRVTRNGDTCVENRGKKAPVLKVSDAFSNDTYELRAGQHVLFEHGSLKEVVDRETSPCGCPPPAPSGISFADSLLDGRPVTPKQAEREHPFPVAVSEGLAEPSPLPIETSGETHVQMADSLRYDGAAAEAQNAAVAPVAAVEEQPVPEHPKGVFHALGRFFKRLFGG